MTGFLTRLREKHAADRAVLIVGHSNTIPELLVHLGAKPDCFQKLGITGQPGSLLIEGYEGVWKVDLKKQGCEAISRE
jgi:broad specificity phosphatase PhoE